jgi:hypothetical protein
MKPALGLNVSHIDPVQDLSRWLLDESADRIAPHLDSRSGRQFGLRRTDRAKCGDWRACEQCSKLLNQ